VDGQQHFNESGFDGVSLSKRQERDEELLIRALPSGRDWKEDYQRREAIEEKMLQ
jgi:hypothetical protein